MMYIEDKDIHKGHRARMRAKLSLYGPRIFDTYELLEMLLYYKIPKKDTNPVAKRLLGAFGSLDGVFKTSREELMTVDGVGAACAEYLTRVGRLIDFEGEFGKDEAVVVDDYRVAGNLLTDFLSDEGREYNVASLLLDNAMRLIDVCGIPGSSFGSASVKMRYFIDAALSKRAAIVMVGYKHPYGPLFPTESDMVTYKLLKQELGAVGIEVAEQYVVSGGSYVGVKAQLSIRSEASPVLKKFYDSIPKEVTPLG